MTPPILFHLSLYGSSTLLSFVLHAPLSEMLPSVNNYLPLRPRFPVGFLGRVVLMTTLGKKKNSYFCRQVTKTVESQESSPLWVRSYSLASPLRPASHPRSSHTNQNKGKRTKREEWSWLFRRTSRTSETFPTCHWPWTGVRTSRSDRRSSTLPTTRNRTEKQHQGQRGGT